MTDQRVNVLASDKSADALFSEIRYRRHRIVWDVRPRRGTPYWMGKAAVVALGDASIQTRIQTVEGDLSYTSAEETRSYLINAAKAWIDKKIAESKAPDSDYGRVVTWNESFSVGIRKIDKQHRELINIMNFLVENEDASGNSEPIASVLDRMTKYAHYHFETEEALMLEYEYPEYESHRDDHIQFKSKTAKFCLDALQRKETLPDEVISYLRHWLTHHILRTDMKYKPYFVQRGVL
jgi:hemerythrin-like metal-binding protein